MLVGRSTIRFARLVYVAFVLNALGCEESEPPGRRLSSGSVAGSGPEGVSIHEVFPQMPDEWVGTYCGTSHCGLGQACLDAAERTGGRCQGLFCARSCSRDYPCGNDSFCDADRCIPQDLGAIKNVYCNAPDADDGGTADGGE